MLRASLTAMALLAMAAGAPAAAGPWNLFNPAPQGQLRDLQSDRPDRTEGPFTVDAGHLQLEADFLGYAVQKDGPTTTQSLRILPFNLKLGLTDDSDLEWIVQSFSTQYSQDAQSQDSPVAQGFGDMVLRLKFNFWGNAQGPWASGFIPFIKFPSNQDNLGNHALEGGLIFPQDFRLGAGFELGAMLECEFLADGLGDSYHAAGDASFSLSHALYGSLGGFVEYYGQRDFGQGGGWEKTADAGLSLGLGENAQLDCGANFGLPAGDSSDLFAGFTLRH